MVSTMSSTVVQVTDGAVTSASDTIPPMSNIGCVLMGSASRPSWFLLEGFERDANCWCGRLMNMCVYKSVQWR